MPILRRCCCMRDLRKGSIICAAWTMAWSLASLVMTAVQIHERKVGTILTEKGVDGDAVMWLSIALASMVIITAVVLIVGIVKNIWQLMVPWMATVVAMMVLDVSSLIINLVSFGFYSFTVIVMLLWVASTMINVYCELCVVSHCQEVIAGRGETSDYIGNRNGYLVTYTTVISEVHTDQTPVGNGGAVGSVATVYAFNSTHRLESAAAAEDAKEKMTAGSKEKLGAAVGAKWLASTDDTKEKFSIGSTLSV